MKTHLFLKVGSIFAITAPIFVRYYSTIGLIIANCISMILRSIYSIHFASNYFSNTDTKNKKNMFYIVKNIIPHPIVSITFILSFIITFLSHQNCNQQILGSSDSIKVLSKEWCMVALRHVGIGVSCVIVLFTLFIQSESVFVASLKKIIYPDSSVVSADSDRKNK